MQRTSAARGSAGAGALDSVGPSRGLARVRVVETSVRVDPRDRTVARRQDSGARLDGTAVSKIGYREGQSQCPVARESGFPRIVK